MIITQYMRAEHRHCDDIFTNAEQAVIDGDFKKTEEQFLIFANDTLNHFKKEEEILFPTFEQATGNAEGPTRMMRFEHEQVRGLIGRMAESIEKEDKDAYLSLSESMMILLQQHNMKEEQMLYAMCDRVIPQDVKAQTIEKMKAL
ncbi:MAG: hemerythrin HHE cation-binding protein [Sulfurovum sp. FS06-10]|jgi:hemerythrin-like domain-containing protein|nr:MAG: hemerythrin HHE cation-binding protein [Sulfurovum sp. FS06-10]